MTAPILAHYDPEAQYILRTDASYVGIAGHLVQAPRPGEKCGPRLFACCSRTLTKEEKNYPVSHIECLAIVFAIDKFRPYLYGQKFVVETDHHALCFLLKIKNAVSRLGRWSQLVQGHDIDIRY